ncbi:MAG: dCTP deaminase [Burkholderiales bacterium]|nr:dCTP deaminase [Burkholderiales bacterium]
MELLDYEAIQRSLASTDDDSLFIDPLLDASQVGAVTIDFRLGYDFLVSILTRKPAIELSPRLNEQKRSITSYFQETRREVGERFVLYPNQVVISTTLEYLSLPSNMYADILSRSSFTRLGIHINTMIQPGFRGCVPLELFNHGNTPVELVVGCRLCQARFFKADTSVRYLSKGGARKYHGDVRPTVSRADLDDDLARLIKSVGSNI